MVNGGGGCPSSLLHDATASVDLSDVSALYVYVLGNCQLGNCQQGFGPIASSSKKEVFRAEIDVGTFCIKVQCLEERIVASLKKVVTKM